MDVRAHLYRTIWRWHFYAGLFVMPFILCLAITGSIYLFKPQIDRWEERSFRDLPTAHRVSGDEQVARALAAWPGATLDSYRLPLGEGDAALVSVRRRNGTMRDVFVSPQGQVVGDLDPERRITNLVFKLHGTLLMGEKGSWLVELAGSWAIVMILTGLFLWWPVKDQGGGRGPAGVVWPRLRLGRRTFWRDIHAVTGFCVSGFALVLLVTGLPWAAVWGSAFAAVRTELGLVKGAQDWTIGGKAPATAGHDAHQHMAMAGMEMPAKASAVPISQIIARAVPLNLPYPVLIRPPGASDWEMPASAGRWTVKSDTQDRPLRVTVQFDADTGREVSRSGFADKHPIDRAVGYGVAWHEGQLFGWINQLVGLFTATALVTLMVSGFVIWRGRKPEGQLGAPPLPAVPAKIGGVVAIVLLLAALLPLLAASLILLWLFDHLILPRLPRLGAWLGIPIQNHQRKIQ